MSYRTSEVRDLVTYAPPLGPLGGVLNKLLIRSQLERISTIGKPHQRERTRDGEAALAGTNPPLDPACKTALPNVSTPREKKRLWN